jgi:DNA mismatch repair protein MSH3
LRSHQKLMNFRLKEKEQHRETLAAAARAAFIHFQSEIAQHHEFLVVTKQLAIVDCLFSFAQVACLPGYSKPIFVADNRLTIKGGRHPMVNRAFKERS